MTTKLRSWLAVNHTILTNVGSLVGTTVITSASGFAYWWLAARLFPPETVGLASATISAMTLLASIGTLGLGTMLIGNLSKQSDKAGALITSSLIVVGVVSVGLGSIFAIVAPYLSAELAPLSDSLGAILVFSSGVGIAAFSLVLDNALIGLLKGSVQFLRNTLFSIGKLILLFAASLWFAKELGLTVYATWLLGNLLSVAILTVIAISRGIQLIHRPRFALIQKLGRSALQHYALNLALQLPSFALPILVTAILSTALNASFYAAWMITVFTFAVPSHLTTVLYAISAENPSILAQKIRFTLKFSFLAGVLTCGALLVSANIILNLFGSTYAAQAEQSLRILAFGVFPITIKVHYVAIHRIHNRIMPAAKVMAIGGLLELIMAAIGASVGSLSGLSLGWVLAVCIEAAVAAPSVYSAANPIDTSSRHQKGSFLRIFHSGKVRLPQHETVMGYISLNRNIAPDAVRISRLSFQLIRNSSEELETNTFRSANNAVFEDMPLPLSMSASWSIGQTVAFGNTKSIPRRNTSTNLSNKGILDIGGDRLIQVYARAKNLAAELQTAFWSLMGSHGASGLQIIPTVSGWLGKAIPGRANSNASFNTNKLETSVIGYADEGKIIQTYVKTKTFASELNPVSQSLTGSGDMSYSHIMLTVCGCLGLLYIAEILTVFVNLSWGLVLYSGVLLFLLVQAALQWRHSTHKLLLSLTLVPIIRLLNYTLPLSALPFVHNYLIIGMLSLLAIFLTVRALKISLPSLNPLNQRLLPLILISLTGFVFGYLEYQLLKPEPLVQASNWVQILLPALILLMSTGFVEELLFRGLLQKAAAESLGGWGGIVYVSYLYALLQLGHSAWWGAIMIFFVALFYAWVVKKTHNITGVIISHGLTNVLLFIVLPLLMTPGGG